MLSLYTTFLKIGAFAFGGGYAVLSLIIKFVIDTMGWLSPEEFVDVVSISQMTPGPIAINSATFVGQKIGGVIGSVVATAGIVTPQFILMMILGHLLFTKNKKFKVLDWMLEGIKAGVVSLILISAISLFKTSVFQGEFLLKNIDVVAAITFVIGLVLYAKKVSLFKIIAIGACLGIALTLLIK